ncbi:2-succinyl-5-enolpyruvyl-6-hydroxy-3-cyclohexene-1-carboxylic-acid synthase [Sporosarcina sp. FA9]|uniref:2-succinyl-5-enolpyruvyl-6-hydroxy-3- cyclohexene-1-carboxylic-acid synthase n=1 Tax=Sporosarcina sp. FA9 TaxID=3413030 RepID=UPI003F658091
MDNSKMLTNYVRKMTAALMNAGVKAVVISPGSRSTPLAYAFASTEGLEMYMQIDERSAGYFALGLAKASGDPVVLLCTSGTAASNYFPAITEARNARIPLVVITADRPHELRGVGAPQAIDQIQMYGNQVKYSVDFPIPENNRDVDDYIDRQINRILSIALSAPEGPVHLNVPFREPFDIDFDMKTVSSTFVKRFKVTETLNESAVKELTTMLNEAVKGIIVVGEMPINFDKALFWEFAEALNWPVLCDPLSNLRTELSNRSGSLCIDNYDAILKSESFIKQAIPNMVIRFGAQPVSKPLSLFLKKIRPKIVVAVDESPEFRDPIGVVTHHIHSAAEAVLNIRVTKTETAYSKMWIETNEIVSSITAKHGDTIEDEGAFAQLLFDYLPSGADLVSGSSMPIRDIDTFFGKTGKGIAIFSNRGTNGIDGVVSTALGIQAARQRPTWLLIGDLSFLHDVNGLIATRFIEIDLTIVIMNNDGGGIFSYLPQANASTHFEKLFGTPTGLTFGHVAAMYDAQYDAVWTMDEFKSVLPKTKTKPLRIIEVFTDRSENVKGHRKLWTEITKRLDLNG